MAENGKRYVRYLPAALLVVIILTVAIAKTPYFHRYDFDRVYGEVRKLDDKYGTVLHGEQLGGMMVPYDKLNLLLLDLTTLERKVNRSYPTDDRTTVLRFLLARRLMLESQRDFIIAAKIGARGLATDGYRCSEIESIAKSRTYLRESLSAAGQAWDILDLVLQEPGPRRLLGTDESRPKFYDSPLRQIGVERNAQKAAILTCLNAMNVTVEQLQQDGGPLQGENVTQRDLERLYRNPLMENATPANRTIAVKTAK